MKDTNEKIYCIVEDTNDEKNVVIEDELDSRLAQERLSWHASLGADVYIGLSANYKD